MFGKCLSTLSTRLKHSLVALLFVGTQLVFPLGLSGAFVGHAAAAQKCTIDTAGANDVPGQKDLTQMCSDTTNLPTSEHITWNWDELGSSGANTLDACALFDTDGDGNVNYSACVSTTGNPAVFSGLTIYSCNDTSTEKCLGNATVASSPTALSQCALAPGTDPFPAGANYPLDTMADCTVFLSEVGGQNSASLLDVCSYPSGQPTSAPSDCIVAQKSKAKLEVVKSLSPTNDPGLFDLKIDGTTDATGVGNGGSTGTVEVDAGNNNSHSVSEVANVNSPTALSAYSSSIVCKDAHGTGNTIASGNSTSLSGISVADDSDVLCTITNTRQTGSITLIKSVTNNNGGTATANQFGLSIGGTSVTSGQTLTLNPGNYAINEAGKTGYQFVNITGDAQCPSVLGGNVTLAANQNVTCTITNDDIAPSLTVVKNVTNDNGGTATANQFTLRVNGTQLTGGILSNSNLTDTYTVSNPQAGTAYTASEDSFSGYTSSGFTCTDNSTHANVGNPVTLSLGQNVTCTVTNNDNAPQLTLVKHVTNDNGGTNTAGQWTLKAQHSNDPAVINQQGTESNNGTVATTSTVAVTANVGYALSESGPTGYSPSSWNCNGGNLQSNTVTLGVGDNVTCTITNNDIAPLLTVTKVVNNNNGGTLGASDFPLFVSGTQVTSGVQATFNAGQYTVSETQQSGYTLFSITGDCLSNGNITMVVGGVYSCTLTNNDVPANITVTKVVHNNHGGTAKVSDFTLKVGTTTVTSGVTNTFAANQQYTVSEVAQVNGYHQDSIVCTDTDTKANLGATFTPSLAENIACTITNSDIAPQLTVIKHVVNNNGGNATANQFTMDVTGTNVSPNSSFAGAENPGTTVTLDAGSYSVDEHGGPSGYTKNIGQNCSGTIALGDTVTCVITNDDQAPTLTVVKDVTNDNGGNNTADSFTVNVNGSSLSGGVLSNGNLTDTYTVPNVTANTDYTVGENDPSPSYSQASLVCKDNSTHNTVSNPVNLAPGQNVTCTITNDDVAPTLSVVKNVTNDNGGTTTADKFTLRVNNGKLTGGNLSNNDQTDTYSFANAQANTTYTLSEDSFFGYTAGAWSCTDNDTQQAVSLTNNAFSLNEGQNVTCAITNDDIAPTITVNKVIDPSNDTGLFDLSVNGKTNNFSSTTTGQGNGGTTGAVAVTNGDYYVSEVASANSPSALTDYTTTWSCDNGTTGTGTTSDSFSVGSGDAVNCTFYNTRLGSIVIVKDAQPDANQWFDFTGDLGGFQLNDDGTGTLNSKLFDHLSQGTYTVTEPATVKGWDLISVNCVGGSDAKGNNRNAVVKLAPGENVICTFTNQAVPPTLTVIKHVDNTNGNNATADQFTMHVTNTADPSDANFPGAESPGNTVTMNTGDYTVTEDSLPGYTASFSGDCTGTLGLGDNATCTITNTANPPELDITKSNDKPDTTVVGDTVTYTLVVTVPTDSGTVFDASVVDLPPSNFTVDPNSTSATLTDTDNSTTNLNVNPNYGSPGIWNLGTLKPGQKITLVYKAKIGSNVSTGTYPDLAFTSGCSTPGCSPANVTGNLNAATPFVGTKVTVAAVIKPTTFAAGQVLGAEILVNTGTNLLTAQYVLPVILVIGLYITRRMTEEKGGK